MEFVQKSTDTSLGWGKGDYSLVTLTSFSRSHWPFETKILVEKSLCDPLEVRGVSNKHYLLTFFILHASEVYARAGINSRR